MLGDIKDTPHLVGVKQSRRAIGEGLVQIAYMAQDADEAVRVPLEALCQDAGVTIIPVPTMRELGVACGIPVGATIAVILK